MWYIRPGPKGPDITKYQNAEDRMKKCDAYKCPKCQMFDNKITTCKLVNMS